MDAFSGKIHGAAMLEPVAYLLRDAGRPWLDALAIAGISEKQLALPSLHVSIDQILAFYEQAMRIAPEPTFAVEAGLRFHLTTYGIYGFAILSGADLRHALRFALQYHQLAAPLTQAAFTETNGQASWIFRPLAHPKLVGPLYEFVVQLHVAIFLSLLHDLGEATPGSVSMTFTAPDEAVRRLREVMPVNIVKGDWNGFCFPADALDHPSRMGSPAVNRMLVEICDAELTQLRKRTGLSGRVRELLMTHAGPPMAKETVADQLGLSERTLRRRLAREGTSLTALHDELRLQLAEEFLSDTSLNLEEIAYALGFSEGSSFRRTFLRWTRMTPGRYRERAADDAGPGRRSSNTTRGGPAQPNSR